MGFGETIDSPSAWAKLVETVGFERDRGIMAPREKFSTAPLNVLENGEVRFGGAERTVTSPDDPPMSGGHLSRGTSKPPPRSAREGSGIIIKIRRSSYSAVSDRSRESTEGSPIPTGLVTDGGAKTRCMLI